MDDWLFPFLIFHQAVAQTRAVTGIVTNSISEPLPGVTVLIKGTNNGMMSSADGRYSLANVTESDILVFSFTGMKSIELAVGNKTIIDVVLEDDITQLKDVIVVGYGTREVEDVTGAVSTIKSKDLELRPNTQLGSMLYGKAAGVVVNPGSGKPGEGISISIRGLSSVGGSDPLYVIDGVPTANTRFLNPADIESVTVLKDASSAAIYGAQGATGVVLITTKSGKSSTPVVDFNMYGGFTEISKRYDLLNASQYQDLMTDLGFNTNWTSFSRIPIGRIKSFRTGECKTISCLFQANRIIQITTYLAPGWRKWVP